MTRSYRTVVRAVIESSALQAWVAARVVVLGALALTIYVTDDLDATSPRGRVDLLGWDASWYRDLAAEGYEGVAREALRFFPLLPLLARVLAVVLLDRPGLAVLVVANVGALVAAVLVHRLTLHETRDERTASRATWLLTLAPPAFTFVMGYAESLLIAASVATFLALRRRQWWWAAAFGALAALARPVGVALVVPALIEAARGVRRAPTRDRGPRAAAVLGPVVGMSLFLGWVWFRFGDPLVPLRLQEAASRRGGIVDPVTSLVDAARDLSGGDLIGSGLHLPWALGAVVLLAITFWKWPASYGAFALLLLAAALMAENLDSFERYALSAFPLVLALAGVTRAVWAERLALSLAAAGMASYAFLAFLGAYVP